MLNTSYEFFKYIDETIIVQVTSKKGVIELNCDEIYQSQEITSAEELNDEVVKLQQAITSHFSLDADAASALNDAVHFMKATIIADQFMFEVNREFEIPWLPLRAASTTTLSAGEFSGTPALSIICENNVITALLAVTNASSELVKEYELSDLDSVQDCKDWLNSIIDVWYDGEADISELGAVFNLLNAILDDNQ